MRNLSPVSAEAFVTAWSESASSAEVASALNMTLSAVRARAKHYRHKGIALKRMPGRKLDIKALNALLR